MAIMLYKDEVRRKALDFFYVHDTLKDSSSK